ncbi:GNAT family N-acetyltransferase [Bradyrhizobium sp. IC3069]|uniref:GNAT family N-acetyltransferase n=1 Tax=unclassified Bradyrhizobium TaxID=2631580 RepID=UPI001CD4FFFA|nr:MULTISPECIES: GNAT family N-acetyltransferase [unclassified Bradyrhizobium]MCA1360806.1 GNAT family N-acetyltransferase [Bradyrhizobium sp. IC4059]MCA1518396.1 GNAT family N-acetyltransferase [Bradyrhizobium sp. IC3069]
MVSTREVSVDDATTVSQMVGALLTELGASDVQAELDARLVADLLATKERIHGFLGFVEERAVGIIMVAESISLFARGPYGIITELYVVPDHRSSGVAMSLIEAAVALGTAKGWGQLEVGAPKQPVWSRSPNSALYLKAGFAEMGPRLKLPLHDVTGSRTPAKPPPPSRLERRRRHVLRRQNPDTAVARAGWPAPN